MTKITDQFKVGDKVKWATLKRLPSGAYEVMYYQGVIETITAAGACALVRQSGERLELVSLFELEVIE